MTTEAQFNDIPRVQKVVAVLWPSFIMSSIATIVFFTLFNPIDMLTCNGYSDVSQMAAYTIGFFLFWALTGSSCVLSMYFQRPCSTVGRKSK